jgi:uncharacterized membrane protein YgcG
MFGRSAGDNGPVEVPSPEECARKFPAVVKRISRENRVRQKTAAKWLHEAIKFLDAVADAKDPIAPSKKVDEAWHAFILHTNQYMSWCEGRYGRYIHHVPMDKPDRKAYARSYSTMRSRYGDLDRHVWPVPGGWGAGAAGGASCGGGSCGGGHHGGSCGGGASCGGGGCGGGGN